MARDIVELVSPLPLDTCRTLLAARIDSPWTYFGGRPLIGRLWGTGLRVRRRHGYRNSFATYLTVRLADEVGRTRLTCRFGLHPAVVAFMTIWLLVVGLVSAATIVAAVHALATDARRLPAPQGLAIPLVMLALGIAVVVIARHLARGDRDDLLAIGRDGEGHDERGWPLGRGMAWPRGFPSPPGSRLRAPGRRLLWGGVRGGGSCRDSARGQSATPLSGIDPHP